jgi:hypothetical protein
VPCTMGMCFALSLFNKFIGFAKFGQIGQHTFYYKIILDALCLD